MSIYSVHLREQGSKPDLAVIPDGFSWGAAVFGFVWALYIGAWDLALALLVIQMATGTLIPLLIENVAAQGMVQLGVAVSIGFGAQELRRLLMDWRGLRECGVVSGDNPMDAERRFLDTHPDITQRLLGAMA